MGKPGEAARLTKFDMLLMHLIAEIQNPGRASAKLNIATTISENRCYFLVIMT